MMSKKKGNVVYKKRNEKNIDTSADFANNKTSDRQPEAKERT